MSRTRSNFSKTVLSSWFSLVVTSVCQLVTIPIALSELNKNEFALFAVISQMLMVVMLAEFGVRSACSRLLIDALAKGQEDYRRMWMASAVVFCIQAGVMLLFMLCLAPFIGGLFHLQPAEVAVAREVFIAVGLIKVVCYALSIYPTSLFAAQQLAHVNVLTTISTVLQLLVFTVAIKSGLGLWSYPAALLAQVVCSQIMAFARAARHGLLVRPSFALFDWKNAKAVFRLGFDVFIAALFSMVMGNSLLIFSGHLLTLEETAVLAVNLKLITLMTHILQRIPGSAGPMFMKMASERQDQQFRIWWQFVTKATLSLSLFGAGLFVIWNHFVVSHWAGPGMVLALPAAILLSLNAYRYLVHYQFVNSLTVFKEIRRVKLLLLWEVILYTVLAYTLGKEFGMNGLLAANLLSMLGGALPAGLRWMAVFSGVTVRHQILILLRASLPLAASFALVAALTQPIFTSGWFGCGSITLAWVLIFAAIGYLIVLDRRERTEFSGMASRFAGSLLKFAGPSRNTT